MKIAIFTDTYLPQIDGIAHFVKTFVTYLSKKHKVILFAPDYSKNIFKKTKIEDKGDLKIYRIPSTKLPKNKEVNIPVTLTTTVLKVMKEFKPDVIHINSQGIFGLVGALYAKKQNLPLVGTYHTNLGQIAIAKFPIKTVTTLAGKVSIKSAKTLEKGAKQLLDNFSNFIYAKCDVVVSPTILFKKELLKKGLDKEVVVITNGIDINLFKPLQPLKNKKRKSLITVCRISQEKRIQMILHTFKKIVDKDPKWEFTIVGDGPDFINIKDLIKKLNLQKNVTLTGFVKRKTIPELHKNAAIFVTASNMETQSLTALEAMACELPVVTLLEEGAGGMITTGYNGIVIGEDNIDKFAEEIEHLGNETATFEKMAKNAREYALAHSLDEAMKDYEVLLKETIQL